MIDTLADGLIRRPWIALVVALAIETLIFVAGQSDLLASDPLWYADIAHTIATKPAALFDLHDTHPFVMRLGLTVPLSLLYRAFGVSTFVTNSPSLLAALGILLVVYGACATPRAKLFGMAFGVTCIPLAQNAAVLNVDLPCAAVMALSILCLSRRARSPWWIVGGVVAWIAAFLVKESAIWCCAVWIYAIVCDLRALGARRVARAYAPAIVAGAALGAGYLVLCALLWGSAFARFKGLEITHAWSLHGRPTIEWINRLTWQTPLMVIEQFRATLVPVVFAAWLVRGTDRIWCAATAAFVLLFWFGSVSLSAYTPLPISGRMMLPLLPGILVVAALASDRALDRIAQWRWRWLIVTILAIAIVIPAARAIRATVTRARPESESFAVLRAEAADASRHVVIVCGEPRCVPIGNFYFGFALPANVTVVFATDFANAPPPTGATVRALVNLLRSTGAHRTDPKLDMTGPIEALQLPRIAGDRNIHLSDAGDGARLWAALRAASPPGLDDTQP